MTHKQGAQTQATNDLTPAALTRRNFLRGAFAGIGVAATYGLAGCGGSGSDEGGSSSDANDTETIGTVAIGHLNSTAHLLAFVAKEEGFFAEEGIDATLTQFDSSSELVAGLEGSKLQVALIGSVPTLVNQSSGHEVSIFGGAMTNGHGYVIKSEYTKDLDSWDPTILRGKNVAVPRTTVQELELYEICEKYGLTYGEGDDYDVHITYFESQKDAYNAMANDSIDAVSTYSPYTSLAVADGHSIVYTCSEEDIFKNQPCCRQVALTSELEANPELFVAFERAMIRAYAFYKDDANHDATIADVKAYIDIDEDYLDYEIFTPDYCDSNPDPDRQATALLKDEAVDFGYLEDFDLDAHYNTQIYDEALASLEEEDSSNEYYVALREHFSQYE